MRYDTEIACASYLTLHEQKLRIKSFLIEYFGTADFFLAETGFSITAVQEETAFFEWINAGRPDRATRDLFHFKWTERERRSGHFLLKCSLFNCLVRQFHHRADGKIGYGLYPYAEDEKGHWRENPGVGLWIYRER